MRAVDTNVLVRLATRDDARQAAAAAEFIAGGAWVSQVVLAETIWVLVSTYGLSSEEIAIAVEIFLNHSDLAIQEAETVAAALIRFRQRPRVGFPDCLILEVARKAGHLPLGTFDRDLAQLDGSQKL
ncbi:MAG TPA: PIN domain-containing protein [Thermoanaerobaculia bacterium]|jgi:predicted nucleic-acid-binding protein|nr:PIN domain-containing protein [Thermoanaerobaculia bacterium]